LVGKIRKKGDEPLGNIHGVRCRRHPEQCAVDVDEEGAALRVA
jgi:hypothetical protein